MADPAESVVLKRFPDELSALLLVGNLRSQGIPAVVVGGLTAQLRAEAPSTVAVLVRASDLALAEEIVAELAGPDDDARGDEGECEDAYGEEQGEFDPSAAGGIDEDIDDDDHEEPDADPWRHAGGGE
jgi:hypothetical protein